MADQIVHKRYHLEYRLGQGGFSEVWKAWDSHAHRTVAIKLFLQQDEAGIDLCREEFRKTNQLEHPNIIRFLEFGVDHKTPFLVMPYYPGGAALAYAGEISEKEIWFLIRDVASALNHIHNQQPPMLHNDLKPDNFLIDQERECFILSDFGISYSLAEKFQRDLAQDSKKPAGQSPMAYRAPERFNYKDHSEQSPIKASDVWALGACLYELATGELPFGEQGGLYQLMQFTDHQRPVGELVDPLPDRFSSDLRQLIYQALDFKPWNRPLASDFVRLANQHLEQESVAPGKSRLPSQGDAVQELNPAGESGNKLATGTNKRLWMWVGSGGLVAAVLISIAICNPQPFRYAAPPVVSNDLSPADTVPAFDSQPPVKTVKNSSEKPAEQLQNSPPTNEKPDSGKRVNNTPKPNNTPKIKPKEPVSYYLTVRKCNRKIEADSIRDELRLQFQDKRVWVSSDAWAERFQVHIGYFSNQSEATQFGAANRSSILAFSIHEK